MKTRNIQPVTLRFLLSITGMLTVIPSGILFGWDFLSKYLFLTQSNPEHRLASDKRVNMKEFGESTQSERISKEINDTTASKHKISPLDFHL